MHYDCSSEEVLKMASGSSEAGGFTCCVPGCYNNSKKHKRKFSFYNFPGDQNLRRQWLHNISRKDFRPTTGHRVSRAHFESALLKMRLKVERPSLQLINLNLLWIKGNKNWTFWGPPISITIWLVCIIVRWPDQGPTTQNLLWNII